MTAVDIPRWDELSVDTLPDVPGYRVELVNGALVLTPRAGQPHQRAARRLLVELDRVADRSGWEVFSPLRVRVNSRTDREPDLAITTIRGRHEAVPVTEVLLVGELISKGSVVADTREKPAEYADAGVEWFLLASETPAGWTATLYQLGVEPHEQVDAWGGPIADGRYVPVSHGQPAGQLVLPDLFGITIDLRTLS